MKFLFPKIIRGSGIPKLDKTLEKDFKYLSGFFIRNVLSPPLIIIFLLFDGFFVKRGTTGSPEFLLFMILVVSRLRKYEFL